MLKTRKVCFIVTSQIHYARSLTLLGAIRRHPELELQIAVAASALLPQYGDVLAAMEKDGFACNAKILMTLAGGSPVAMAKTTGIGITEFATAFSNLHPDVVLIRGDRYEVLAAAVAASYMNIPIAHLEGGDLSGSIDESVRHAVTKLAHIHLATNDASARRIRQLGEDPAYIMVVGCPELEYLAGHTADITSEELNRQGVGHTLDLQKPFLIVMTHPVTTEERNQENTRMLLQVINGMEIQTVWFWPNVDAGTDDVAKAVRIFREKHTPKNMHFIKYFPPDKFIALLKKCACLAGNSSAGIKECSYLGIPSVNIGSRQEGRLRGPNIIDVGYDPVEMRTAIERQIKHGRYERSDIYCRENTGARIADILATIELYQQKRFHDLPHE
ncbi:UDP-N-acetyl-D-glucosamine 2-epimerase, UDP-hydrolysing [Candidatus Peribacteria bacterium RIFCSPLOWO2_12_FULL_55_15]|nr:MAG: UDP-N-acetyl-D-glucosamine 2-epimerase, UDP-hydrolysing [Candidatus Peribacteria bacterium RIFCSPHIGHO2_01_FULL_54_22]OGJ63273.1 MAG: UDP-N-acetyl-D-glucosamine 2-epimerase, UDP-hydrolysing [Candidatus Peribacteria bacterium RIFCSPHIGHO2_02_FULL_55_24]OGJ68553.1 MAG: UDP-N-acetyl-D-glucosamine 2-epimerase, UDP-hydrolysing [Candidatus Peribacteria bacterium RIFCSPLOWO2_01_FULL_54_110]OGJ70427.1 MAG: UDP-N-acetyl-D-glucosamine 2-epimerase, UDP-hydrolysing [Candidatus Peribacteria bacterium